MICIVFSETDIHRLEQIRKEAAPIFWTENTVEVAVTDWCPVAACFLMRKADALQKEFGNSVNDMDTRITGHPRPHWSNLLEWLRRYHADPTLRPGLAADLILQVLHRSHQERTHLITVMFETVEAMLDKPWRRVEELMLRYRPILAGLEAGWAI